MVFNTGENVGPYRIVEKLGQGGMATVYKAYHPSLDRYVAIKVLHPAFKEDPDFLNRFQREARVVASLDHPNIVPVYDYSEHGDNPYLVMRFVEGETLKARFGRERLGIEEILRIVEGVGEALAYAHERGILHRDIKPSNIMLEEDGRIYLTDFGLARIAAAGESTFSRDTMLGTPQYISPEQAKGDLDLDAGTDIYSFGVVIYELVVGRVPFSADTPFAVVHDHIFTPLPMPRDVNPQVPESVERVLLKGLAKNRADRYETVRELVQAFRAAVEEAGADVVDAAAQVATHARPKAPGRPSTSPREGTQIGTPTAPMPVEFVPIAPRRRNAPWILGGLAALVVLCVAAGVSFSRAFTVTVERLLTPHDTSEPAEGVDVLLSVDEAEQLVEANPDDPAAYVALGRAYYALGEYREAERAFKRALELGLDDEAELLTVAGVMYDAGFYTLAMDYYAQLFVVDPTNPDVQRLAMKTAFRLLEATPEEGWEQLEGLAAEVVNWGLPDAMLAIHELGRPSPDVTLAQRHVTAALDREPESPLVRFAVGRVCEAQGDVMCARSEYEFVLDAPLADEGLRDMANEHLAGLGTGES